jgi:hypothetical protein
VVGYGPFSLWVIHKEALCPSSGDINRLMMKWYERLTDLKAYSDGKYDVFDSLVEWVIEAGSNTLENAIHVGLVSLEVLAIDCWLHAVLENHLSKVKK